MTTNGSKTLGYFLSKHAQCKQLSLISLKYIDLTSIEIETVSIDLFIHFWWKVV